MKQVSPDLLAAALHAAEDPHLRGISLKQHEKAAAIYAALPSASPEANGLREAAHRVIAAFGEYWNDDKGAYDLAEAVSALSDALAQQPTSAEDAP